METLNLVKDQKVDLTKGHAGLTKVTAGFAWDMNRGTSGTYDLDGFAFFIRGTATKAVIGNSDVCFFGNKKIDGVMLDKDNLTGEGEGDDEKIFFELDKIPADVQAVVVGINIYNAASKGQNFSMVSKSFVRLFDTTVPANEFIKYDLNENYGTSTGVIMGFLYRHDGEWKFKALGTGVTGDINVIVSGYTHAA